MGDKLCRMMGTTHLGLGRAVALTEVKAGNPRLVWVQSDL